MVKKMGAISKIISFATVGMLLCTAMVTVQSDQTSDRYSTKSLTFSVPTITDTGDYVTVDMTGPVTYFADPGKPVIPFASVPFSFPLGTKITDIKVTYSGKSQMQVTKKILPMSQPIPLDGRDYPICIREDTEVYLSYAAFPTENYTYQISGGIDEGQLATLLTIQVYPLRYFPLSGKIELYNHVTINIQYIPTTKSAPDEVYDLIILTPVEFRDAMAPLVAHKNGMNVTTKLVVLDDIPAQGKDEQESIKYFIKDAIENWATRFALLVGGSDFFPVRYTHVQLPDDNEEFPSDLYYADIYNGTGDFSDWDSNGNGIYGEYAWEGNTDIIDLYPDVYIGRIPCIDEEEAKTAVNKIITYETSQAFTQDWFTTMIVCGGDSFPGDGNDVDEGEYMNQKVIDVMEGFNVVKIWASTNTLLSVSNIDDALLEGAGFLSLSGHGSPTSWATHPHGKENTWIPTGGYKSRDIAGHTNNNSLPIVITSACSTSKFTTADNSFGWSFISNPNGGGIATCGCAGLGYVYIGKSISSGLVGKMELESFKSFKEGNVITFGELWGKTVTNYIKSRGRLGDGDYKTVEEWQPFGDPSLAIASASLSPLKPSLEGPASGKKGTPYVYIVNTTDPEGDHVSYWFDWGDGTSSGWLGPYNSGVPIEETHIWDSRGNYQIKVKAKDEHGAISPWSDPIEMSLPMKFSVDHDFQQGYIYLFGRPILKTFLGATLLLGGICIQVETEEAIEKVGFYVDGTLKMLDCEYPFEWLWDEPVFGRHILEIVTWTNDDIVGTKRVTVWTLNL